MGSAEGTAFGTGSAPQKVLPTTNRRGGWELFGGWAPQILWAGYGRCRWKFGGREF